MNRRGFFSGLFQNKKLPGQFFWGFQLIIPDNAIDNFQKILKNLISKNQSAKTPDKKRSVYKELSVKLEESLFALEYGFWDYNDDDDESESEFDSWINDIEANISTEKAQLGDNVDEEFRLSGEKNYIAVTVVLLLDGVKQHENLFEILTSFKEDDYFSKETFKKLIESINYIDFNYAIGDAVFMAPGNDDDGLSWEDIHGEGWNYLKPVL